MIQCFGWSIDLPCPEIVAELAPTGVLRAGINLSNFLLVTGKSPALRTEAM
jgi:hypothetical protein